eukprot:6181992-Pleurochrysis_carterae.AAC.1
MYANARKCARTRARHRTWGQSAPSEQYRPASPGTCQQHARGGRRRGTKARPARTRVRKGSEVQSETSHIRKGEDRRACQTETDWTG